MPHETPYTVCTPSGQELARFALSMHVPVFCAQVLEAYGELRLHCACNWLEAASVCADEGEMDFVITAGVFGEPCFTRVLTSAATPAHHPV
ncbi:MAG TPA: hypothetical protein VHP62_01895 [Usitatibacter sp.]|jgi:hypothetical protein|nr:hypothetical protein [Usitatibacter sp.]